MGNTETKHMSVRPWRTPYARRIQNFLLVWLDSNIDEVNNADSTNTISKLREVVNTIHTFTNVDECINFINDVKDEEIFMISSGALGQTAVPIVHAMAQLSTIYIFCGNKPRYEQWVQQWPKIKDVFTDITPICTALKKAVYQCEQNSISMSFVITSSDTTNEKLDQLDQSFMYTQILKEIILTNHFEQQHIQEFITYCRQQFDGNSTELQNVDKLEREYRQHVPIWWYTNQCFLYSMLNRALRMMDIDLIISAGFFIRDLHQAILKLHSKQFAAHTSLNPFTVYRGQGLTQTHFDHLVNIKGSLLSFNNFLSTSLDRQVSLAFAREIMKTSDLVAILFVMKIDPSISSTPFANVRDVSRYQNEEEILFSMHSIFRIINIEQMENSNNRLWKVELVLTSDTDAQLHALTEHIRRETFYHLQGWHRLVDILMKVAQFDKARQVCEAMLLQKPDYSEKANIYHNLGIIKNSQGEYTQAINYFETSIEFLQKLFFSSPSKLATTYSSIGSVYDNMGKYSIALSYHKQALKIYQKSLPENYPHLAVSYCNIGRVYDNMGEYSKALLYHEKALDVRQNMLPPNHPSVATSYNNMGSVYDNMGEYSTALSYYEKALEIRQKTLPKNHPSLAISYSNIGSVYDNMGEHSKAISCHEKTLEIYKKNLPLNHPDFATSYNNLGRVYDNMGEYSKALSYHEKALEIYQKSFQENHPHLAVSHSNLGRVYDNMGEYRKALASYQKALEIRQKTLPENHPSLATSYNNIGKLYDNVGEYSIALSCHKKALKMYQQSLLQNHPDFATSCSNIGSVYDNMGEYSNALPYHETALEIRQKTLPPNHPTVATSYSNIGRVYDKMGEYSKALPYHEKALEIRQKTLPKNHPSLAISYSNIGSVYDNMGEHSKAISCHEKTLEIYQRSLPENHPDFATSYNNMGSVYDKMDEYSKALSYYEKALEIRQKTLPENHPSLAASCSNIESVYEKMYEYSIALLFFEGAFETGQCSPPGNHPDSKIYKQWIAIIKSRN